MEGLIASLIVALAGLAGNVWIASRGLSHQSKMARAEQLELRRTRRQDYRMQLMDRLVKASEDYQSWLGKPGEYRHDDLGGFEHSEIMGRAINACLAAGDEELRLIVEGKDGLTPYRVAKGQDGATIDFQSRNRDGMIKAIKRMSQLIEEVE